MGDDTSYTWAGMGDARNTDVDWPTDGDRLEYDPSTFGGFGKNVAIMGTNLQDDIGGEVSGRLGFGVGTRISTGGYPEGGMCEAEVMDNVNLMRAFLQVLHPSFLAAASAALHCRDAYEHMDSGLAATVGGVKWVWGDSSGKRPPGIPAYIKDIKFLDEPDGTKGGEDGEGESGGSGKETLKEEGSAFQTTWQIYEREDGTTRRVTRTADSITEQVKNPSGVVTSMVTARSDGSKVTQTWDEKGTYQGKNVIEVGEVTEADGRIHQTRTHSAYDEDGKLESSTSEHTVTTEHGDGTENSHYYTEDADGKRSNEVYVGRQPKAVTQQDYLDPENQRLGSQELNGR